MRYSFLNAPTRVMPFPIKVFVFNNIADFNVVMSTVQSLIGENGLYFVVLAYFGKSDACSLLRMSKNPYYVLYDSVLSAQLGRNLTDQEFKDLFYGKDHSDLQFLCDDHLDDFVTDYGKSCPFSVEQTQMLSLIGCNVLEIKSVYTGIFAERFMTSALDLAVRYDSSTFIFKKTAVSLSAPELDNTSEVL